LALRLPTGLASQPIGIEKLVQKVKSGETVEQVRYVLNWRDPRTRQREQRFFERQKDAQEKRAELVAAFERGTYSAERKTVTVRNAVAAWLETKRSVVRPVTFAAYEFQSPLRRRSAGSSRGAPGDRSIGRRREAQSAQHRSPR